MFMLLLQNDLEVRWYFVEVFSSCLLFLGVDLFFAEILILLVHHELLLIFQKLLEIFEQLGIGIEGILVAMLQNLIDVCHLQATVVFKILVHVGALSFDGV